MVNIDSRLELFEAKWIDVPAAGDALRRLSTK